MNTESNRPSPGGPDEDPVPIGAGLAPVAERLRRSLAEEARSITPSDRLGVILTEARTAEPRTSRPHRWLLPAAAAAVVALGAGTTWAVNRPSTTIPPAAAISSSSTTQTPSTAPPSTGPSAVPTQTASGPVSVPSTPPPSKTPELVRVTVPVYYTGPDVAGSSRLRLFREFVGTQVPGPADPEKRALAALRLSMGPAPAGSTYVTSWSGITPTAVSLDGPGTIEVALSGGLGSQPQGGSALAVQQLVWTVQAAIGKGTLPVRFVVPGGGDVAPGQPSDRAYNRPTDVVVVSTLLAPIWVDEPFRGEVLAPGSPLTVKGLASVFEATVEWQLLRSGTEVEKGFTTASVGGPARGTYTFQTQASLTPGDYVLRVFETSAKDGSVAAEQRIRFTVGQQ